MNIRKNELTTCLRTYLDRKSVPMNLNGKPEAQQSEINALLHSVIRHAPKENYVEWFGRLEIALGDASKTRGWPTEGEIKSAARSIEVPSSKRPANVEDIDPLEEMSRRMNAGEDVGDSCFYGRMAVDMKARGLIHESTLRSYRSAWYFSAKKTYGEGKARELEDRLRQRQAEAEKWSDNGKRYSAPSPDVKRVPAHEWDGAA